MDKEFEALEDFKELKEVLANQKIKYAGIVNFNLDTIEQALTEFKAIKESNPSEALKAYEYIKVHLDVTDIRGSIYDFEENLKTICLFLKNARELEHRTLLKAQEQEKENAEYKEALRIIFEKEVDIETLKYRLRVKDDDVYLHYKYDFIMTREQFEKLVNYAKKLIAEEMKELKEDK